MEVVMSVSRAQGEGITVTLEVIKTHDYVMQPVWSVENTIVSIEDLGKLGIVGWSESRRDSIGKTDQERIGGSFERIDVAQLIGRSAGDLACRSETICAQPRSTDSLRFRRIEKAIEKRRIQPLKFIGSEKENLILYYRTAQ